MNLIKTIRFILQNNLLKIDQNRPRWILKNKSMKSFTAYTYVACALKGGIYNYTIDILSLIVGRCKKYIILINSQ